MVLLVALPFRLWVRWRIIEAAREQAEKGLAGSMEGHAAMDMSVSARRHRLARPARGGGSPRSATSSSMEWAAVIRDIVGQAC